MDLFSSRIAVPHHHLVQLSCDMVCGSGICIPIGIHTIPTMICRVGALLIRDNEVLVEPVLAVYHGVPLLLAELEPDLWLAGVGVSSMSFSRSVASTAATSIATATTSTTISTTAGCHVGR